MEGPLVVRTCEVLSVEDKQEGDRIKVRMYPEDGPQTSLDKIPYCFPLLPKVLHVKPKVGETVLVITSIASDGESQRFYVGPVISQPNKVPGDYFEGTSRTMLLNGGIPAPAPSQDQKCNPKGCYYDDEDVGLTGRGNADIQLKKNDLRLRCGVKKRTEDGSNFNFNVTDPAFIKLKYYPIGIGELRGVNRCNSTVTVAADKINLIGTASKEKYNMHDTDELISDETMSKIINEAHQLPYGDVLVQFLSDFRKAFLSHTHSFAMKTPVLDDNVTNVASTNLKDMLSDTVRIN